ncbi:hypothetical protein HHI36_012490 [Cryptolaemus montrouzieri]|uniref:Succinate dehydrogenase cytochrome b560 subunit, mitochondrial n=1 Tax=Cryptolaemus montrouzieri TaxID=559131 RepID=A0ABD2NFV7_9CUCU
MSISRIISRFSLYPKSLLAPRYAPTYKILCREVRIDPRQAEPPVTTRSEDYYDESNRVRGRPMAPSISIYATEIQGVMSISNRVTGVAWTMEIVTFAICALVLPESVDYYVEKINSWNIDPVIIFVCKLFLAWPICYHTIDGSRHLLWDLGWKLNVKRVIISGWLVILLSIISTICMGFY